ncbi:virulence factor [Legionella sp. W05-934-2]|uniref:virulence factor n=1 Tax=Legionella sp. W05-934-2 TaxID=1198649 RepID=UPI0034618789
MADNETPPSTEEIVDPSIDQLLDVSLNALSGDELTAAVYFLWQEWADFGMHVISPSIESYHAPVIHKPEKISDNEYEFVYDICDWGNILVTSKGVTGFSQGRSMCRLNYTIEKMIYLLIERLRTGGVDPQTEVEIAFEGHLLAQRYAFSSVINLEENVVVVNFDPGRWGEVYLETLSRLSERGYGYPAGSPRDIFRASHSGSQGKTNPR